jgi:hypothetical protein
MKESTLIKRWNVSIIATLMASLMMVFGSVTTADAQNRLSKSKKQDNAKNTISEQEVLEAQRVWGEGIVKIGKVYQSGGDYRKAASEHIDKLYAYDMVNVLFKPTLAAEKQFRTDLEGALSYFVGKNPKYSEDKGFAITPWSNVRWENIGVISSGNMAVAMGNYYFTPASGGDEVKVEYSFGYLKDDKGNLRIVLHDSHIPYSPQ